MTETFPIDDADSIINDIQSRPDCTVYLIEGPRSRFIDTLVIQDEKKGKIVVYADDLESSEKLRKVIRKINPNKIQYSY